MFRTPQYTVEQRIFLVNHSARGDSTRAINYDFKRTFPFSGRSPKKLTIRRQTKKFDREGTVLNLNKGRSGRKPTALTEDKLQMLKDLVESEMDLPARVSRSSSRKHSLPVPMSKSSFNRGIKKLGFHPYKLIYKNKLKPCDFPRRVAMCNHVLTRNGEDQTWLNNLWTSDEANFNLNGIVNSKNVLCYAPKFGGRPQDFSVETVKHPDGVMVFACLRLDGKKMPLKFFYPRWVNGERVSGSLDGEGYYKLLRYHCLPHIRAVNNGCLDGQTWQQDGASPHRTTRVMNYLQASFGTNLLALGSETRGGREWCPNSPDLAPLDFCIWGVMKSHVFQHPMPQSRDELVEKIISVWETFITVDLIKRAAKGFLSRCQKVLDQGGRHQLDE